MFSQKRIITCPHDLMWIIKYFLVLNKVGHIRVCIILFCISDLGNTETFQNKIVYVVKFIKLHQVSPLFCRVYTNFKIFLLLYFKSYVFLTQFLRF